ncbi:MAG: dihydrofolate reductase [Bacteriovoracales bacterium]|nr:dihydrofolate reductase [Bacteriovoracales bacterium]
MIVSAIAAMGKNRLIGKDGGLPWHLPKEFAHFKAKTLGHVVITGRKNFECLGRPLPGRPTVIVTRNPKYCENGCHVALSLEEALNKARDLGETEAFVIGGGELYKSALPHLHRFYRTIVDFEGPGDVYFPPYSQYPWKVVESFSMEVGEKNPLAWTYDLLEKTPLPNG